MRIAIDLEGVLADSNVNFPQIIEERFNVKAPPSFQYQWNLIEALKYALGIEISSDEHQGLWDETWKRWDKIPPIDHSAALEVLENLVNRGHQVVILTHSFNTRIELNKRKWIEKHFPDCPEENVVWVNGNGKQKWDYNFDLFIDDGPHNIVSLKRHGKRCLVFTQPWNRGVNHDWYWARADNWSEVGYAVFGFEEEQKL